LIHSSIVTISVLAPFLEARILATIVVKIVTVDLQVLTAVAQQFVIRMVAVNWGRARARPTNCSRNDGTQALVMSTTDSATPL
jgi:hypothetical protein